MLRWLSKFIYYKILGWRVTGNKTFSKDTVKKAVLIAAPHTSWHDFFIGLFLRGTVGIKSHFIGKKELFIGPLGWYLRWVGGSPLDRTSGQNKVQAIAKLFEEKEEFRLALAPEGTRKKVTEWKTGFYYIALEAKVPIIMFTLDFANKKNHVSEPFYPSGNVEEDMRFIRKYFENVIGKIPKYS